jgi:glycosyltransferase involved in cell wall biosynthesis
MPEFGGEGALYFDPRSPSDLAEKLAALLDDAPRMRELALKAESQSQRYASQSFAQKTWHSILQLNHT